MQLFSLRPGSCNLQPAETARKRRPELHHHRSNRCIFRCTPEAMSGDFHLWTFGQHTTLRNLRDLRSGNFSAMSAEPRLLPQNQNADRQSPSGFLLPAVAPGCIFPDLRPFAFQTSPEALCVACPQLAALSAVRRPAIVPKLVSPVEQLFASIARSRQRWFAQTQAPF